MRILSFLWKNRESKRQNNRDSVPNSDLSDFLGTYTPGACTPSSTAIITKYKHKVPESLLALWKINGFGAYNNGLITIINPDNYNATLSTWLGKEFSNYVPIAITAFGDLFYYRKLTDTVEDICVLQTHLRKANTCSWSLKEFFNSYLCNEDIQTTVLRKDLYAKAVASYGSLDTHEIFYFTPALMIGGTETIQHVKKGNAQIHLSVLFQLN